MILKPDDFEIGSYITILNNDSYKKETELFDPGTFSSVVKIITNEDRSGMGDVLEVIAINLPYIVCKHHSKYKHNIYNTSYDVRRTKFISLNSDYTKVLIREE
mgnify:CR=1 FL=1